MKTQLNALSAQSGLLLDKNGVFWLILRKKCVVLQGDIVKNKIVFECKIKPFRAKRCQIVATLIRLIPFCHPYFKQGRAHGSATGCAIVRARIMRGGEIAMISQLNWHETRADFSGDRRGNDWLIGDKGGVVGVGKSLRLTLTPRSPRRDHGAFFQ